MNKQKIIAVLLAVALLCTTAFAATTPTTQNGKDLTETDTHAEFLITSFVNLPTIKVKIGTITQIVANPYKMQYDPIGDGDDADMVDDTVISKPTTIQSDSTIAIKVVAEPSATTDGNVKILTSPILNKDEKSIFLQFCMAEIAGVGGTGKTAAEGYTPVDADAISIKQSGTTPLNTKEITLPAASTDNGTASTWGAFKIRGECAGTGWTNSDAVTVSLVFDIAPVVPAT